MILVIKLLTKEQGGHKHRIKIIVKTKGIIECQLSWHMQW